MSVKQLVYIVGLVVVLGLLAWGLSQVHAPQAAPAPEAHILSGTATTTAAGAGYVYSEEHPYYTVSVLYPETNNAAAQQVIEAALKDEIGQYSSNVADLDPSIMPSLESGYKLALIIDYKKFTGAGSTASYLFSVYEDTGGAHPNHYFKTFVFGPAGQTVGLSDVFVATSTNPHAQYLNQIAGIASNDIEGQMRQRIGGDPAGSIFAEGLAPSAENYQDFVIDGSTLKFFFPPYQVAAYAAGDFEVDIPLSKFGDVLAPAFK